MLSLQFAILVIIVDLSENYVEIMIKLFIGFLRADSGKLISSDFKIKMRNLLGHSVVMIASTICTEIYSLLQEYELALYVVSVLCVLFNPHRMATAKSCYDPHFTEDETEAQRKIHNSSRSYNTSI